MCGISGIISLDKINVAQAVFSMSKILAHRGPDGEGFYFFDGETDVVACSNDTPIDIQNASLNYAPKTNITDINNEDIKVGFAHRRLAIIDLEATGHQPQCNADANIWLTFNGEIYNYIELKVELEKLGHQFISNSDTEVIIKSYLEWGKNCVQKFNGMWAFALFDKRNNQVWICRDRFGVKPLYYFKTNTFFAFASEQKSLLSLRKFGLIETGINEKAVFDYFIHNQIEYEEEGMFKNIFELMPSQQITLDVRSLESNIEKYYTLEAEHKYFKYDVEENKHFAQQLKTVFFEAVKKRLRSDVAVGACLSGGIDSSAIVCAMHEIEPNTKFHTFTTTFEKTQFDESNYAKLVSDNAKTRFHSITPNSKQLLNDLQALMYCQDVPIWSTSTYAQFSLMQLAKENKIKVVMDGQGGDELFGGYPHHLLSYTSENIQNNFGIGIKLFFDNASYLTKTYLKSNFANKFNPSSIKAFQKQYREDIAYFNDSFLDEHKERFKNNFSQNLNGLNSQLLQELNNSLLKNYLKCEDRCSMHHSVESRTPFSDDLPLIEFAMQIPSSYKIHNGVHKSILRDAMKDVVPPEILNRKDKMGYSTPNNQWIFEIKDDVKHYFENPALKKFIDTDKLLANYDSFFDVRSKAETGRVFKFISFAVWLKVFELE